MSPLRTCAVLVLLALAAAPRPALAQAESKCSAAKLKAAGAYFAALAKCKSKAVAKAVATDPECNARALAKLEKAIQKAEAKGDCITLDAGQPVAVALDEAAEDVIQILAPSCCDLGTACGWLTESVCLAHSGTAGAPGTVCSGTGACVAPPAAAGACCENTFVLGGGLLVCLANTSQGDCELTDGTHSASAVCQPTQACVAPAP